MQKSRNKNTSFNTRILKALSIFGGIEFISILCSIVRTKLVALWIGAAGVGLMALYNSTLEMLRSIMLLNMRQSGVREIAAADASERAIYCRSTNRLGVYIGIVSSIIVAVASPLLSKFTFGTYSHTWAFAVLSVTMFAASIADARRAVLQGLDMLKPLAQSSLYAAVFSTVIAIPLFYYFRLDAIVAVIALFYISAMAFTLLPKLPIPKVMPVRVEQRRVMKKMLALGGYLTVAASTTAIANYLLRVYLNASASVEYVGLFQAGYTLVNTYVGIVFTAISMEFFPRLSAAIKKTSTSQIIVSHEISIVTWIILPIIVVFICADELIVRILYSATFLEIMPYISVAIIGTILRGVSWCLAYVIIAKGDGKVYVITEAISAVATLVLSIIGWHLWGYVGLALAYNIEYLIYTFTTGYVCRKRYGIKLSRTNHWLIATSLSVSIAALCLKLTFAWWVVAIVILPWLIPLSIKYLHRR